MAYEMSANLAFAFATSVLLTLFAVAVGAIGRFRGPPLWFMMFEGGFGVTAALSNLEEAFSSGLEWYEVPYWMVFTFGLGQACAAAVAITGLWRLAHRFPDTTFALAARQRAWSALPLVALVAAFAWAIADELREAPEAIDPFALGGFVASNGAVVALTGAMWSAVILMAARHASATPPQRSQLALVASAVTIYPTMYWSWATMPFAVAGDFPVAALFLATLLAVALMVVAWLRRTAEQGAAGARNVAFVALAAAIVGMSVAASHRLGTEWSPSGIARIAAILIMAYAVLRHQVLGIDVKVRFAISKSTLAAIFVAVFFIVSEAAQQYFGHSFREQRFGQYMGIAAAGGLVFAFAPLQRLADRVAAKAVPPAVPSGAWGAASAAAAGDDLYRRALRLALADRRLSAEEELTLAELSERLGLGARRALELRLEVEAERASAAPKPQSGRARRAPKRKA